MTSIITENTTPLTPEMPLGRHGVSVDGPGRLFVVWNDAGDFRVQVYDRDHNILKSWFTAFTDANAVGDAVIESFASGGIAVCYFKTTGDIGYAYIDQDGNYVPSATGSFAAGFDPTYPQMAVTTNSLDHLCVAYFESNAIYAKITTGMPTGTTSELTPFQVSLSFVPDQIAPDEWSLFNVTSNWTGGRFACFYMRHYLVPPVEMCPTSGHGVIRKFDSDGNFPPGGETDVLEKLRSGDVGGADAGNPSIQMRESSEEVFFVNAIVTAPPYNIRTRVYNSDPVTGQITGAVWSTIQSNPLPATTKLNVLGAGYFSSGNAFFVIDDENTNLNAFYLDNTGTLLDSNISMDGAPSGYLTGNGVIPSLYGLGNRALVAFHDPFGALPSGASFVVATKLDSEIHNRGYPLSTDVDVIRNLGIDDEAVTELSIPGANVVDPGPRMTDNLIDFIGSAKDIALVGGPIFNDNSRDILEDAVGQLKDDLDQQLKEDGILSLYFDDLDGDGTLLDDRDGTTTNAPKIRMESTEGTYVMARHKIGSTIYDYALALKLDANKRCYIFAGIRDIGTRAVAERIMNDDLENDNPLENFDMVLAIVKYPDTVTSVAGFETELGLSNAEILFRPLVGVRENSPLN